MFNLIFVVMFLLCSLVTANIYLHNPRGSNNRLDESGRERDNKDRLFDSQNNARGGYNVGNLYYYAGSQLTIEWTNQHSCGGPNANCEIIVQYMCDKNIRDGHKTSSIPVYPENCLNNDCNTDWNFGMNEDYNYYMNCKITKRNRGLFTAEQNLHGTTAQYTRQNYGGTRSGYECPEERDYYPYWRPTPWKDIVVMTNNVSRCDWYQQESENVKSRFVCVPPDGYIETINYSKRLLEISKESCETIEWPRGSKKKAIWTEIPSKNIRFPDCILSPKSRDNHNGNGFGGFANTYNWTIPNDINENCVLRLRYNISTGDFPTTVDSSNNEVNNLKIGPLVGLSDTDARNRGYVFESNPIVQPLKLDNSILGNKLELRLAISSSQYGRTFQDRSHRFAIRPPPASFDGARMYNLNVRGKRGNIFQVYPAVEYDYVPSRLTLSVSDAIHIQWTGSDTNARNDEGQSTAGTDRSNIILLRDQNYPEGNPGQAVPHDYKRGHYGNSYPMNVSTPSKSFLGFGLDDTIKLAILTPEVIGARNALLADAGRYFDLGPRLLTSSGTYYYMCTRNNNFSNRSQKGKIIVLSPKKGKTLRKIRSILTKQLGRKKANYSLYTGHYL